MKRIFLALLLLIVTTIPAAASIISINFTFLGSAYTDGVNSAVVTGTIGFDSTLLSNPGYNSFDLTTPGGLAAVPYLTVTVSNSTGGLGDGTFTRNDFSQVIFDTSTATYLTGGGLNMAQWTELVGQTTSSPNSKTWGTPDLIPETTPPGSYSGDFQLVAAAGSPSAPTGISPFQLGTFGAANDGVQLTSMFITPEPTTYVLLSLSLGVVGLARKKLKKTA